MSIVEILALTMLLGMFIAFIASINDHHKTERIIMRGVTVLGLVTLSFIGYDLFAAWVEARGGLFVE